jgi:hypothetical protein
MLMMKLQEAGVESEADLLVGTDAVDAKLTSPQEKVQFRPPPRHLLCFRSGNLVWDFYNERRVYLRRYSLFRAISPHQQHCSVDVLITT